MGCPGQGAGGNLVERRRVSKKSVGGCALGPRLYRGGDVA